LLIGNTTGNTLTKATLTAGTGITVTNGTGSITIDAINNGTVTSVDASGGTTGLSFSGGPITTSGTLTLAGTLITSNGGTGLIVTPQVILFITPREPHFLKTCDWFKHLYSYLNRNRSPVV
jgi:hypothetical protein